MLVVVGGLETEHQAEVAETDNSSAPIRFEIVNISNSVDPKSDEQIQSQSIAETSLVDMTGDSFNEDQIMVQEDGTLLKVPPTKRKQKKDKGKATPGLSKKLTIEDETTSDSERDFSEWSLPERLVPDGQGRQGYSLDQVRTFLERTKGKRDVVVEDYFPNRLLLIGTVRKRIRHRGGNGLVETEVQAEETVAEDSNK